MKVLFLSLGLISKEMTSIIQITQKIKIFIGLTDICILRIHLKGQLSSDHFHGRLFNVITRGPRPEFQPHWPAAATCTRHWCLLTSWQKRKPPDYQLAQIQRKYIRKWKFIDIWLQNKTTAMQYEAFIQVPKFPNHHLFRAQSIWRGPCSPTSGVTASGSTSMVMTRGLVLANIPPQPWHCINEA